MDSQSRRNAEAKPETSSCEPGNIAMRGDLLELLLDRCSHYPLQGTSVILFDVFVWSFVAVSLRVEPRRRALSVGSPPRGVTHHTQEVCRPPHLRGRGPRGPRAAGHTTESRARRQHPAQSHSCRGKAPSNRRADRRPPETGAATLAREAAILRERTRGDVRVQSVSSE